MVIEDTKTEIKLYKKLSRSELMQDIQKRQRLGKWIVPLEKLTKSQINNPLGLIITNVKTENIKQEVKEEPMEH